MRWDECVGALVTLDLAAESPLYAMPWIITFGPLSDEDEWEPVVCGPYERPHALALAESVVADEELMAVVEPLLPHTSVDEIRAEIAAAQLADESDVDEDVDDLDADLDEADEDSAEGRVTPSAPPTPAEVRAGFERISARLTSPI